MERLGMSEFAFGRPVDCLSAPEQASLPVVSVRPEGLAQALDRLEPGQAAFARATGFTAAPGQLLLLPGGAGLSGALLGLGNGRDPWPYGALPFGLPENSVWRLEPGDFDME